jgi:RNA polymerase sigma-70 factor (ECF subfamily)
LHFLPPWKENEVGTFPDTPVTLLARIAVEATGQRTDEAAWVRLFNLYAPAIRRFAELQGTPSSESEDVTQDIFLRLVAILRGGRYRADAGRFRCYLATLVRNELVSRWRKVQARAACVPLDAVPDEAIATLPPEAAALLDAKWRLARHEAAIEHALTKTALSRQSREIYRAYALEGRPIDEVASAFGVSRNVVAQVKTRVNRMVASLEAEYAE